MWCLEESNILTPTIRSRIQAAFPKVRNLSDIVVIDKFELVKLTGLSVHEVDAVRSSIYFICKNDAKSLISMIREETTCPSIQLNDALLDSVLGHSILKHDVTIISGPPGMGKTQFVYTILCQCIQQSKKCLYVNGGCNLVIDRLVEMLHVQGADSSICLSSLYIEQGYDAYELYDILEKYDQRMNDSNWGCVIIDSITPFLQPLMNPDLMNGKVLMSHLLQFMRDIAGRHKIPVIMTNQTRRDGESKMKNALHTNINYFVDSLINLAKTDNEYIIQLVKCGSMKTPIIVPFTINTCGIEGIHKE